MTVRNAPPTAPIKNKIKFLISGEYIIQLYSLTSVYLCLFVIFKVCSLFIQFLHFCNLCICFTNTFFIIKSSLVVGTSQVGRKGFKIDNVYNGKVFVVETSKNLVFLTTVPTSLWSPTIKFRAIVTAEGIILYSKYILLVQ